MSSTLSTFALFLTLGTGGEQGAWPQYNGPQSDRVASEELAVRSWPKEGPPVRWKVPTELGFSSFVVENGLAYTLVERGGRETLVCLDAETGGEEWSRALGRADYDGGGERGASGNDGGDGPRSTPSVVGGAVYVLGGDLMLVCFDARSGGEVWSVDIAREHAGQDLKWQNAASPLVDGGRVFVAAGGAGQTFLAFDADTGKLAWKFGDEKMTHSTPTAATIDGQRQILFFVQSGVVAADPATGAELWRADYPYKVSTAISPVVHEDLVYLSAGYGVGGGTYRIHHDEDGWRPELLWQKRNRLMNHWSTPVCHDGQLYGMFSFKEYGEGPLACVDIETGEERWSQSGFGPGNVILVGETLVALSDAGEVVLVEPTPAAYRELARADVLDGKCWSSPAFASGRVFVRSTKEGACVDLRADG